MTNPIAVVLGLILIGMIVGDVIVFDAANLLFLGKKLADLIEWIAFWR
ncbi:MAG: hypothetical protein P8Q26_12020 [Ascidiaceihabitans sp.]|nr:hypothetical protein [Ascidiaceihabitans sp.]